MEALAAEKGWPMSHVALAWLAGRGVSSPVIGLSGGVERLDEAVTAAGKRLEEEEVRKLEEGYVPKHVMGH